MSDRSWFPGWREQTLSELDNNAHFDLVVVGGGITGAGIYREACLHGLNVLLVEQQDFAWGTSSRSSKMVHGGLRYLGKGQFSLAKDSVTERQNLMHQLKGLVDPLPFLMTHYKGGFPGPWIFDKLLAIYDFFSGKKQRKFFNEGLRDFLVPGINGEDLLGATQFMDAVTDDARLVLRVLQDGNQNGGIALNYVKAIDLIRPSSDSNAEANVEGIQLKDEISGKTFSVSASAVVNATGAWTDELRQGLGKNKQIRPLRGSHLVLPFWRLPVAFSVSFFHPSDKRPVFVFPWEGQVVVGTTDLDHPTSLSREAAISESELDYLLQAVNTQFANAKIEAKDVVATWSGVRPVVVDEYSDGASDSDDEKKPSDEKREHMVWDDQACISIAGGKLTTFRLLALEVLQHAKPYLSDKLSENAFQIPSGFEPCHLSTDVSLSQQNKERLLGRYGARADELLQAIQDPKALESLGASQVMLAELLWACAHESIEHLDDLLLRRVRIGMLYQHGAIDLVDPFADDLKRALNWSDERWQDERRRYLAIIDQYYSVPKEASPLANQQSLEV